MSSTNFPLTLILPTLINQIMQLLFKIKFILKKVHKSLLCFQYSSLWMHVEKQQGMVQVLGPLLLMGEILMELSTPGFSLTPSRQLWPLTE